MLNLLKLLLESNPEKRISATEALNHEFFKVDPLKEPKNVTIDLSDIFLTNNSIQTFNSSFNSFVFRKAIYNGKIESVEGISESSNCVVSPSRPKYKNSKFSNNFSSEIESNNNTSNNNNEIRNAVAKKTSIKIDMHKSALLNSLHKSDNKSLYGKNFQRSSFEEKKKN